MNAELTAEDSIRAFAIAHSQVRRGEWVDLGPGQEKTLVGRNGAIACLLPAPIGRGWDFAVKLHPLCGPISGHVTTIEMAKMQVERILVTHFGPSEANVGLWNSEIDVSSRLAPRRDQADGLLRFRGWR